MSGGWRRRAAVAGATRRPRGRRFVLSLLFPLLAVLSGCAGFADFGAESVGAGRPGTPPWLDDPRVYAQSIAAADRSRRARERQDAIDYLLRDPRAESAVRVQLVFAAAIQDLEEAHVAGDELASALTQARSPFAEAVLTGVAFGTEQRAQALREVLESANQLNVEAERREQAEGEAARLARERVRLQQALDDVQEKLRALISIEQQLQEDRG